MLAGGLLGASGGGAPQRRDGQAGGLFADVDAGAVGFAVLQDGEAHGAAFGLGDCSLSDVPGLRVTVGAVLVRAEQRAGAGDLDGESGRRAMALADQAGVVHVLGLQRLLHAGAFEVDLGFGCGLGCRADGRRLGHDGRCDEFALVHGNLLHVSEEQM